MNTETFTAEEIKTAKEVRDSIIKEDIPELKSIYMAGEIVMWAEMRDNQFKEPIKSNEGNVWVKVENDLPPTCTIVDGFNEIWIDEDFNPEGIRECFLADEGYWTSAEWNNDQDTWDADNKFSPTHWKQRVPPNKDENPITPVKSNDVPNDPVVCWSNLEKNGWKYVDTDYYIKDGFSVWRYDKWYLELSPRAADEKPVRILEGIKTISEINSAIAKFKISKPVRPVPVSEIYNSEKQKSNDVGDERFKIPTDNEIIKIALIFNNGRLDAGELTNMVSMCQFVTDRLYENGDIMIPSSKETQ